MAHQYTTMVLGWIDVVNNVQPCRCSANGMRRRSDVVVLSGTWVEKYTTQDRGKMQLEDDTTAQIIRWLEDDHKPSQAESALASPVIKYFWLLRRQLIVLSGMVYYQNKQDALAIEVEGYWWLQNHCRESYWSIVMTNLELDTWG